MVGRLEAELMFPENRKLVSCPTTFGSPWLLRGAISDEVGLFFGHAGSFLGTASFPHFELTSTIWGPFSLVNEVTISQGQFRQDGDLYLAICRYKYGVSVKTK